VSGVIQHELAEKEAWTGLGNGFGMRKRAGQGRAWDLAFLAGSTKRSMGNIIDNGSVRVPTRSIVYLLAREFSRTISLDTPP
jgi:hypothetical protein